MEKFQQLTFHRSEPGNWRMNFGGNYITQYANECPIDAIEDWAESVSLYLYDQRHGSLFHRRTASFRDLFNKQRDHRTFQELFPARAALLNEWFATP